MGAPLATQPIEIVTLEARHIENTEASSGSEASDGVFARCLAAASKLAGLRATPITPLGLPLAGARGRRPRTLRAQ